MHSVNIYKWGTIEKTDLPNIVRLQGHTRHYLCLWLSHIVSNYASSYERWRMKRHVLTDGRGEMVAARAGPH